MEKKVSQQLQVCYLGFLRCRQTVDRDSYKWVYKKGFDCWWIYLGWWWVVVDIFWPVVGGGGYIMAGGRWWWMVVGGGIVQSDPK